MLYPIDSIDDVQTEVTDLLHLLEVTTWGLTGVDRTGMGTAPKNELDRMNALVRIAQEKVERLSVEISANHRKIGGGE